MGELKAFPSYPAALVIVGLDGVEEELLAVVGGACTLLICHWSTKMRSKMRNVSPHSFQTSQIRGRVVSAQMLFGWKERLGGGGERRKHTVCVHTRVLRVLKNKLFFW